MSSPFPKLPLLGNPQVTINMNNKTKFNNSNPQLSNGLFLSVMPCKPQKLCNLSTPLTLPPLYSKFRPRNPYGIA